jgi:hypothetical protein
VSKITDAHKAFEWVGREGEYLMGVPARDLYPRDLMEVEEREGITQEEIAQSGLYAPVNLAEVEPFCGAPLYGGERCREPVAAWGLRCEEHGALTVINGIGPETAACLREREIGTAWDLAGMTDARLKAMADTIPRVSARQMRDWREQALAISREAEVEQRLEGDDGP